MAPEHAAGFSRGLRGPASRMSPLAGVALFAATAVLWFVTTQPAGALDIWRSDTPLNVEQWAVLYSSIFGVLVLAAGLFAAAAYVVHLPAITNREVRQMVVAARAELRELQLAQARLAARVASLQRLRSRIAIYEAELLHAEQDTAVEAGRVMANGREVVDDIIAELESAGVPVGPG